MSSRGTLHATIPLAIALLVSLATLSCSPEIGGPVSDYQLLVFPGEAELGGSAAAVISSNYIPGADSSEEYQLEFSRVEIRVEDSAAVERSATVRAVFPLSASAASKLAQTRPGAWATVVLFDLPNSSSFTLGTPPFDADVILRIDGVNVTDAEATGTIRITGPGGSGVGGQSTMVLWPTLLEELELDSVVARFRPVMEVETNPGVGFPDESGGIVIGGIEADLVYFSPCFTDAEAYSGTEASGGGIYLGPQVVVGGGGFIAYRRLILTHPNGFTLQHPSSGAPDALGEGPVIDIAFDRPNQSIFDCDEIAMSDSLWLWNVHVVHPDGSTIVDQRGTGELNETSDLFTLHPIPVEP